LQTGDPQKQVRHNLRYDPHICLQELSKIMHTEVQLASETRSECLLNVKHECPYVTVCLRRTRCLQRITESHMANCALKSSADSFLGFANL